MRHALSGLAIACALGVLPSHAQPPASRILKLEELRFPQIAALDRERTMFILPIGMLEEHGPHLPIASDTFGVMFEADGLARRVSRELPKWQLVMMPPINYGETGANEIGGVFAHPGTYGIRHSTLRSLVADIGAQVEQEFEVEHHLRSAIEGCVDAATRGSRTIEPRAGPLPEPRPIAARPLEAMRRPIVTPARRK